MSGVPAQHWHRITLDQIARAFVSGGTPASSETEYWNGEIAWTTSAPIGTDDVRIGSGQRWITLAGLENSSTNIVPRGNLLIGTRVGVGKAVVNEIDIAISQDLTGVLLDTSRAIPDFVAYSFKTDSVQQFLEGRKRGTTIKGVSRFDLQLVPLNLPPLPEQRAIAAVLRVVQDARDARHREVELERERKAALLHHVFTYGAGSSDRSTRRTDFGEVPGDWGNAPLSECAVVQTGVAKGRKVSESIRIPYLRVANVQDGYLDLTEIKEIEIAPKELDRYRLQHGDVVLTEGGDFDKLGRGFVWSGQIEPCVHQNHVFAVRVDRAKLLPEFFAYQAGSPYGKAYFLSVAHKTTNLACINTTKLKAFPVLLPLLDEQQQIVDVLRACDAKITALEAEIALHDELFRAMLEELMTGRLSALPLVDAEGANG